MIKEVSSRKWNLPVSLKHTHEIMEFIKNKKIDTAIAYLEQVKPGKLGIPFKKFNSKGHKHGVPTGYPKKATRFIIKMLKELKNNVKVRGLDPNSAIISNYNLGRGAYPRYISGTVMRRGKHTNISITAKVEYDENAQKLQIVDKQKNNLNAEVKENVEVKDDKENNKQSN